MDATAYHLRLPAGLVPRLREGDARVDHSPDESLQQPWKEISPELARLAAALGMRREQCDDVLQDVYVTAREQRPAGLCGEELRRWLFRVTANRCRLEHRRRGRWRRVAAGLADWWRGSAQQSGASADGLLQNELTQRVEAALAQLKMVEREVIVLRYFCDFDASEISQQLALPAATVRSHLLKARRQLARILAPWKPEE